MKKLIYNSRTKSFSRNFSEDIEKCWKFLSPPWEITASELKKLISQTGKPLLDQWDKAISSLSMDYETLISIESTNPSLLAKLNKNYKKIIEYLKINLDDSLKSQKEIRDKFILMKIVYDRLRGIEYSYKLGSNSTIYLRSRYFTIVFSDDQYNEIIKSNDKLPSDVGCDITMPDENQDKFIATYYLR